MGKLAGLKMRSELYMLEIYFIKMCLIFYR